MSPFYWFSIKCCERLRSLPEIAVIILEGISMSVIWMVCHHAREVQPLNRLTCSLIHQETFTSDSTGWTFLVGSWRKVGNKKSWFCTLRFCWFGTPKALAFWFTEHYSSSLGSTHSFRMEKPKCNGLCYLWQNSTLIYHIEFRSEFSILLFKSKGLCNGSVSFFF